MQATIPRLTRRRLLLSSISAAAAWQLQQAARAAGFFATSPPCRLAAEQEEGPYYIADELVRSALAEGKPGIPLSVRILLLDERTCKPLPHASVDLWHCDALGLYSGFTTQSPMGPGGHRGRGPFAGPPPGPPPDFDAQHPGDFPGPPERVGPPPQNHPTDKLTFLRGIQLTGEDGAVTYRTVFPGFYMGRTNHIHFKVRVESGDGSHAAGHTAHTGQLFFPEAIAAELMRHEPYSLHKIHRTTQEEDHVFSSQGGDLSIAHLQILNPRHMEEGLHIDLMASVDPTATPAGVERRGMPGRRPFDH